MLKLIPKYQRGNVVPVRATPTLKKKSWESEEDYQDRIARQSNENIDSIKQEQLKAKQLNIKNREEYINSKEGQLRMKKNQNKDSQLFSNIKVTTNNNLQQKANFIQNAMQADINTSQSIKVEQAIRNQIQKKLDKWKDYKNGLDALLQNQVCQEVLYQEPILIGENGKQLLLLLKELWQIFFRKPNYLCRLEVL